MTDTELDELVVELAGRDTKARIEGGDLMTYGPGDLLARKAAAAIQSLTAKLGEKERELGEREADIRGLKVALSYAPGHTVMTDTELDKLVEMLEGDPYWFPEAAAAITELRRRLATPAAGERVVERSERYDQKRGFVFVDTVQQENLTAAIAVAYDSWHRRKYGKPVSVDNDMCVEIANAVRAAPAAKAAPHGEWRRGDLALCIEKPDYLQVLQGFSKDKEYVVNAVKREHNAIYLQILGEDDHGHWLLQDMFRSVAAPTPGREGE
jgi:hypothetical protein